MHHQSLALKPRYTSLYLNVLSFWSHLNQLKMIQGDMVNDTYWHIRRARFGSLSDLETNKIIWTKQKGLGLTDITNCIKV